MFKVGDFVRMTKEGIANYISDNNDWWLDFHNITPSDCFIVETITTRNSLVLRHPMYTREFRIGRVKNWELVSSKPIINSIEHKIKALYKKSKYEWVKKWGT